jgi:hypothetical protein
MRTLLEELKLRIDRANAQRSADDPIQPMAHVYLYEKDQHGDQLNLHSRVIKSIGNDYIEVQGEGMVDRANVRNISPINF